MGDVPYGYAADKNVRDKAGLTLVASKLVVNDAEQSVIATVKALRASGSTLQAIADTL